tara:strand:+ start:736 stop:1326 length:591 start_codon:yes stop_codon:yes gene_type:complete
MIIAKKHILWVVTSCYLLCASLPLLATTLFVDPTKSVIKFSTKQLFGHQVNGEFLGYSVVIKLKDTKTIERIEAVIDSNSIFTDNSIRDRHLRQERFLDYKKYDFITFIAEGPILLTDRVVKGKLTIKGITKEIELPVLFEFLQSSATGQFVLSIIIDNIVLNRYDYNIKSFPGLINKDVNINIKLINRVYVQVDK